MYANRRRIKGERGKRLLRSRGEKLERTFAHCYETGAMRRLHLRGRDNIAKRVLIHAAAFNVGLMMRVRYGLRKPRSHPRGRRGGVRDRFLRWWSGSGRSSRLSGSSRRPFRRAEQCSSGIRPWLPPEPKAWFCHGLLAAVASGWLKILDFSA